MIKFCKVSLKTIIITLMLFLTIISLFETQRCGRATKNELVNGYPIYKDIDNIFIHMGAFIILLLSMYLIKRYTTKDRGVIKFIGKHIRIFQCIIAIISGIIALLIVLDGTRSPISDQLQIHVAAQLFNEENYINLSKGGYLNLYPQQLGYVTFMQTIYRLFGSPNFQNVQIINCFFVTGTTFTVCTLINDIAKDAPPRIVGSILVAFLLPIQLMGSWLYGDLIYYMFSFIFLHNFLLVHKNKSRKNALLCIISATICLIFKKHALIFLIAIVIVSILSFIEKKEGKFLLFGLLCFVIPWFTIQGIDKYYSKVSGYEIDGGIPSIAWITMGTLEDYSAPGWFNNYSVPLFFSNNFDRKLTYIHAKQDLQIRLHYFVDHPVYTLSFYKRKICTQWNDPFFNTDQMIPIDSNESLKGISLFLTENQDEVLIFLSVLQSIIYTGTFAYVCFISYKKEFSNTLPEMIILGGFLFSIIWEAKSRYVLNNYLLMFPLAAVGWYQLFINLETLKIKLITKLK